MPIIKPFNPWENNDPFGNAERFQNSDGFKLMQWPIKLWKISETAPFFDKIDDHKGENHYEETNSVGIHTAGKIAEAFEATLIALAD